MKIEINRLPENFKPPAIWPEKFDIVSWVEFVTAIPQAISVVTTYKENDIPNACPQAWTLYSGDGAGYYIIFSIMKRTHTYTNILRNKEFVFNFPTASLFRKCMDTIRQTSEDVDEITTCGLTVEPAKVVHAPRIKECFVNIECRLGWHRPLHKDSFHYVFAGEVVHVAIDSEKAKLNSNGRYGDNGYIYNIHSPTDPTTGQQEPDKVGKIVPICDMDELG
jgi:flavin reductase (DIM6/NTAB) family NADH-FMN oxidoreductase RutF